MTYPYCIPNKVDTYTCEGCKEKFRLKATLILHQKVCIDFQELKEKELKDKKSNAQKLYNQE
jgi:hypothetical protein